MIASDCYTIISCLLCRGKRPPDSPQLTYDRFTCNVGHFAVTIGLELVAD